MTCVHLLGAILTVGGPVHAIDVAGKRILFEMHSYLGPMPVSRDGNGRDLAPRHLFWTAVTWWDRQGRQMNDDGTCRWVAKSEDELLADEGMKRVHVAGKHWRLVPLEPHQPTPQRAGETESKP